MSDVHSSYHAHAQDEHVFKPEEPEAGPDAASKTQSLSISEMDKKFDGYSKSASDCLHKTYRLALELNHGTVCAAHLILAMTLIPNASKQFELRKVDINRAYRAAMTALTELERGSPTGHAARSSSEELNNIINLAREFASNRDNQDVSVDDLLTALDRLPSDAPASMLIRGQRNDQPEYDLKELFTQFAAGLGHQVNEIVRLIHAADADAVTARELSEIKSYLQSRDGTLERLIAVELAEIRTNLTALKTPESDKALPEAATNGGSQKTSSWLTDMFTNGKIEHR